MAPEQRGQAALPSPLLEGLDSKHMKRQEAALKYRLHQVHQVPPCCTAAAHLSVRNKILGAMQEDDMHAALASIKKRLVSKTQLTPT